MGCMNSSSPPGEGIVKQAMGEPTSSVPTASASPNAPRSHRRSGWWIVGGCVFACGIAIVVAGYPYYRKRKLINEIERIHGMTANQGQLPPSWITPLLSAIGEPRASQLSELIFDELDVVKLPDSTPDQPLPGSTWILNELARHPKLRRLLISNARLSSDDLQAMRRLISLEELSLAGCSLDPPGLEALSGMAQLQKLDLSDVSVTDADLKHITSLPHLHSLLLTGSQVTDAALPELSKLKTLRHLDLTRTSVSEETSKKLVESTPGLDISDD